MAPSDDYGNSVAANARSLGQNALNAFDPSATGNKIASGFSNLFGGQQNEQQKYIDAYKASIAQNPSATQLYEQANQKYQIPTLASNANYLQNQILQTPQQQLQMARGFNVDQNQVNNAVNQQLTRLSPLASSATNNLNTAMGLAQGEVQAGMEQNAINLLPVQKQGEMMSDLWAREASGFTTAAQAELQGLIAKMQSGVALSQSEMERANALANAQVSYQNAITAANASQNVAKIGAQNVTLSPGSTYLNTATGQAYNPFAKVR